MNNENTAQRISPISRLLILLNIIKNMNANDNILKAWKGVFGLRAETPIYEVFPYIISVKDLIDECEKVVNVYAKPKSKPKYLKALKSLSVFYSHTNLGESVQHLKSRITDLEIQALEFCDDELSEVVYEEKIDTKEIEDLIKQVNELIENITQSEIDDKIKLFSTELLTSIHNALIRYRIVGIESIYETLEKEYLKINYVVEHFEGDLKKEKSNFLKIFGKLGKFVTEANKTYTFGSNLIAISGPAYDILKLLPPG